MNKTTPEQQATPAPLAHKDIRIPLKQIGDRRFELAGFLNANEPSVTGHEMLARTDGDGMVVGEEDYQYLKEHWGEFEDALNEALSAMPDVNWVATKRRHPAFPDNVSCFGRFDDGWGESRNWLGNRWDERDLVLRRCT